MPSRLLVTVFLSCVLACATTPARSTDSPAPTPAASTDVTASTEAAASTDALVSVRPGVNDRYFEDGVERWTKTLEQERREVIAERDRIVAALELRPGLIVADIGAGTGPFIGPLSRGVGESGKLYAVDIVPSFLDHLRARASKAGLGNVEVVEATPTAVNLPDDSIDLMFMCDVYHHIEYPIVYARTLHRALRADGRLIIVEFDRIPGKTSEGMLKHVRQDQATLTRELAEAGFVVEREITEVPLDENYMLVFRKATN
jgi:ubiquinone/menaquinone biosynthesis C-methylase UbiE